MSALRWVVVDDTDPQITYQGPWRTTNGLRYDSLGNFGKTYNNSLHGMVGDRGSLSFTFNGTRARLYGTSDIKNTTGTIDPTWSCFVDNMGVVANSPFPTVQNNWLLCDWVDLPDGQHTVTVNASSTEKSFWVDRILYVPSPTVKLERASVLVDRGDPNISAGSGWTSLGTIGIMARKTGATLRFKFKGSRVTWVGTIPMELPRSPSSATYSIDGQEPVRFTLPGLSGSSDTSFNYVFFQTDSMPAGDHELVVTHEGSESSTPLVLGNLIVDDEASVIQQPPSTKSNLVGPIVGAVFGGLILITLTFIAIVYVRRRVRARGASSYKPILVEEPFHYIRPFTLSRPHDPYDPQPSMTTIPSTRAPSSISSHGQHITPYPFTAPSASVSSHPDTTYNPGVIRPPPPPEPTLPMSRRELKIAEASGARNPHHPHPTPTPPRSSQSSSSNASHSKSSRVVIHQDSGMRLPGSTPEEIQTPVIEHPPHYTPG